MTPEAWGFFSVLTTTSGATLVGLSGLRSRIGKVDSKVDVVDSKADTAATAAMDTAKAIAPVSNGYAKHTTESLASLHTAVGDLRDMIVADRRLLVEHIAAHASSDLSKGRGG